jgi:hypothetical protein
MPKQLEAGDYLFCESREGLTLYKIHRTTKTLAITAKDVRFKREIADDGTIKPHPNDGGRWSTNRYLEFTKELESRCLMQNIRRRLNKINYNTLEDTTVMDIYIILRRDLGENNV